MVVQQISSFAKKGIQDQSFAQKFRVEIFQVGVSFECVKICPLLHKLFTVACENAGGRVGG